MFRALSERWSMRLAVACVAAAPLVLAGCHDDTDTEEILAIILVAAEVVIGILAVVL